MSLENSPCFHKTRLVFLNTVWFHKYSKWGEEEICLCACPQKKLLAASEKILIPSPLALPATYSPPAGSTCLAVKHRLCQASSLQGIVKKPLKAELETWEWAFLGVSCWGYHPHVPATLNACLQPLALRMALQSTPTWWSHRATSTWSNTHPAKRMQYNA